MQVTAAPQTRIDDYLAELRKRLRSLPDDQIADIVEEIRSHLLDTAASGGQMTEAGIDGTLRQLGPPAALAASYLTDNLLARGRGRSWPWTILHAIFRWATLSVKGFLVFMVCTMGYAFGVSFFLVALLKPFYRNAGLWLIGPDTYSLVLGVTNASRSGHELLGWTIIPIGLALGGGTILLTTHFAWWCIGRFRQTRPTMRSGINVS
jgi:uncharacterized membrane protein